MSGEKRPSTAAAPPTSTSSVQRLMMKKVGRGGKLYTPAESGDGVAFEFERIKPAVLSRIEALGKMNDRREAYKAANNWMSLLELAAEYEAKRMPVMAEAVRKDAYEISGQWTVDSGRQKRGKDKKRGGAAGVGGKVGRANVAHDGKRAGRTNAGNAGVDVRPGGHP